MKVASARPLMYGLGGLGLAALENAYVGKELPPELKNVNMGLGGITGLLMASPDPKLRAAALGSVPLKEMGLFGIGALDKLRKQQQSLVDANLSVADVNKQTAEIQRSNASGQKWLSAAFLLPALAAGAGVGYLGYEKWRKAKQSIPRYRTVGERGRDSAARSKIRIDIPSSAVPPEFYKSLSTPEEYNRSHVRFLQLANPGDRQKLVDEAMAAMPSEDQSKVSAFIKASTTADNERITVPRLLWDVGSEFTGIPSVVRAMRDAGAAGGHFMNDDGAQAARYGLGALGNAAVGLVGLRLGLAPVLGRLARSKRLLAHIGVDAADAASKGLATVPKPGFRMPMLANWINRHSFGEDAMNVARDNRFAYNPRAFSWMGPGGEPGMFRPSAGAKALREPGIGGGKVKMKGFDVPAGTTGDYSMPGMTGMEAGTGGGSPILNSLYQRFLTAPKRTPVTLPGHMLNLGRYGANRALQGAYWTRQLAGRYPNVTLTAAGAPLAGIGMERDRVKDEEARRSLTGYLPDWAANRGHFGMPLTGSMNRVFQTLGIPDTSTKLREQIANPTQYTDPFSPFR